MHFENAHYIARDSLFQYEVTGIDDYDRVSYEPVGKHVQNGSDSHHIRPALLDAEWLQMCLYRTCEFKTKSIKPCQHGLHFYKHIITKNIIS